MKVAMVSPDRESEKAISGYSEEAIKALKKNKVDTDFVTHKRGSPSSFFKLFPKFKKYDIVHIQHEYNLLGWFGIPYFLIYFYFLLPRKYKVITTMHTALPMSEKFPGNPLKTILRKMLYFFQNRIINWGSDRIFVHSQFFVPVLESYGVPKKKISVLPQGIIEEGKITPKNKAKKELGISGPLYLIIGNLQFGKGTDIVVRQADKIGKTILVASSPDPVNDGKQKRLLGIIEGLRKYAKDNNLKKYVRFDIAPINDKMPKWWKYFSAADLVLLPYRGGIGSGIMAHALSAKKPIVSSNILFFKNVADRYDCIKIAKKQTDYGKTIHEAMKPKNYKKMVKESERYLKENSWSAVTKKYKEIYSDLLK